MPIASGINLGPERGADGAEDHGVADDVTARAIDPERSDQRDGFLDRL
jgi:hypothetical protein